MRPDFPWASYIGSGVGLIGIAWIVAYYFSDGALPVPSWEKWNLVAGIVLVSASIVAASRQK